VNFERDDAVGSKRFKQARNIARGHRIVRLGPAVLAGVAEIGNDGGDTRGTRILQSAYREQESA